MSGIIKRLFQAIGFMTSMPQDFEINFKIFGYFRIFESF